jgi:hypothetical protein
MDACLVNFLPHSCKRGFAIVDGFVIWAEVLDMFMLITVVFDGRSFHLAVGPLGGKTFIGLLSG